MAIKNFNILHVKMPDFDWLIQGRQWQILHTLILSFREMFDQVWALLIMDDGYVHS